MPLTAGTILGQYEIRSPLGAGGMGEVYRAHDKRLDREVAIKILPESLTSDPGRLQRFEQEARATAALNHPNILSVFEMDTHGSVSYLVEELLEGETLRERLRHGPIPLRKTIDYGVQIARGLAAAHEKGIVHRDLKPENLFLTKDGRVKILDFGLARLVPSKVASGEEATVTQRTDPGMVLGTAGYMSPEQVRGKTVDHRTDIFAFGTILFEMITGKRAFQKPSSIETMHAILSEEPQSLSQVGANTPPGLQRVVHRCLEKDPDQRFQSSSDLAFALDALSESGPVTMVAASRPLFRRVSTWVVAAASLILLLALYFMVFSRPAPLRLGRATRLTNDGFSKTGLATDGIRLYFNEQVGTDFKIVQVSTSGGETSVLPVDLRSAEGQDISPNGSELLVETREADTDGDLWILPLPSGAPRRVGNLTASSATWLPEGDRLAYIKKESELYVTRTDGTDIRKLLTKDRLQRVVSSPDGQQFRLDVWDTQKQKTTIWQAKRDGSDLRPLFPEAPKQEADSCCGIWTPNGKHFVFLRHLAPHWSRDGKHIAFTTHKPGEPWKIYTIARDGGTPEPLLPEQHRQLIASWGPDDQLIAIGRPNRETPMTIQIFDVKANKASDLPGSEDLWLPDWSPDGRYIAACSRDYNRVMLFDFTTHQWRQLEEGTTTRPRFSHDSKYVYFEKFPTAIYRASVSDGKIEKVVDLGDIRRPFVSYWGLWFGLSTDDSPIIMQDLGTQEIYAFEVTQ